MQRDIHLGKDNARVRVPVTLIDHGSASNLFTLNFPVDRSVAVSHGTRRCIIRPAVEL